MGRTRTPTAVLEMRDTYKRNPEYRNKHEPIPETAFPDNPSQRLTVQEQACFIEIAKQAPPGVLTGSDVLAVEIAAQLLARWREKGDLPDGKLTRLLTLIGRFGMDPSGRAGLVVPRKAKNPFDDV